MFRVQEKSHATSYMELKQQIHGTVLEEIDFESLNGLTEQSARERVSWMLRELFRKEKAPLTLAEREQMVTEILDELFGLGPLQPLLADPSISDILVNGCDQVYVERKGRLELSSTRFVDNHHLMRIIERIVSQVGRRIDESSPMVDTRLPDGSRVNVLIPPLSLCGPVVCIRRFGQDPLTMDSLLANSSLTQPMAELLSAAVRGRLNILISGGTGAGKTTLLNALSAFIPPYERVITIEDAAELQLRQPHVVRLETRPPNVEGRGAVKQRQLVINSLRMRPDRIIIGECRGEEAIDMLQAMNTGHEGSMTTIHANNPRDALNRLETMVSMANLSLPERAIRQQIASALALVVQATRLSDGSRRVTNISEVAGLQGDQLVVNDLYVYKRQGLDKSGRVLGEFVCTRKVPSFAEKLQGAGISLPPELMGG